MVRIACLVIGYAFGLFQTSFIYGKANGIDIREHGSGNAGSTNMLRTLGLKAGLITFAGDVLKCILAIITVQVLFGSSHMDMIPLLKMYTAAGTILGHNFPFYLNFKGGKGIAATAGLVLSFHPVIAVLGIITFFTTFFTTHYVSLGSLLVYLGIMVELVVMGQLGYFAMSQPYLNELYAVAFALSVMAYWKHKDNIKRLLSGNERKTYLKKKEN
ncbi:MAG: glycerol-3-phosphate 1-O-acyltransferase PlsY [Lachnospiraceae bacterium]|nr:glycerol-3-phosphate 1-O-acyltransferase PlsY [Lachnospiraceae bacterium]